MNQSTSTFEDLPRQSRLQQAGDVVRALPWFALAPLYRRWHLHWGATDQEVRGSMPGDELVPVSHFTATRAISIVAPPTEVWPWLLQVGFHRAGFYSYDLLDSLGAPSATEILTEWQSLRVGDVVAPMAEPATPSTSFVVAEIRRPESLVWKKPDSTWAWRLSVLPDGGTRLVTRLKVRYRPDLSALVTVPLIEFGDFPMMRKMLRGIKARSEATPRVSTSDRQPARGGAPGWLTDVEASRKVSDDD